MLVGTGGTGLFVIGAGGGNLLLIAVGGGGGNLFVNATAREEIGLPLRI